MKKFLSLLILSACLLINAGCEAYVSGPYDDPDGDTPVLYGVSSIYTEGVDDSGNMWVELQGSFSPDGNTVEMDCGGNSLYPQISSQNDTTIEVVVPAASDYDNCNFTVITADGVAVSAGGSLSAMEITGSQVAPDVNPNYLDVTLQGTFYVQPPSQSEISVLASCDNGQSTFTPNVLALGASRIVVMVPNPSFSKNCDFTVQDTFTDGQNNDITVSSPEVSTTI